MPRYGYAVLEGATVDDRHAELLAIAAEADGDRTLARADDADAFYANDPRARRYDLTKDATEWCAAQRRMTVAFLDRLAQGVAGSIEEVANDAAVFSRRRERERGAAARALSHWWSACGGHMPDYFRGLDYDRTNYDELSTPVRDPARPA